MKNRPKDISITWDNEKIRLSMDEDGWYVPKDEEWFGHSCKVDHNFKRENLIEILEKDFDEWSKDYDWWSGTHNWDVNVFDNGVTDLGYGQRFQVTVYGLELMQGQLEMDTDTVIDEFFIHL